MSASERLSDIEDLLRHLPGPKRAVLLIAITDLLLEGTANYKPSQIALFDRLFNALIADTDAETLALLSRRLAPIDTAPSQTIARLAQNDEIAIAEPVLMRSPCVQDSVLGEIARTKGQLHLLAIACRPKVPMAIVDLLIARGDDVTQRYVVNNQGAQISGTCAAALAERAKSDDVLAELISARDDMPPQFRTASVSARTKSSADAAA